MRYQRNALRRSRPDGLGRPRATTHTADSYRAKYVRPGPNANVNRTRRLARMVRREAQENV